jgi:dipeptidyl aminopeptidase/acylaminoacyl peptidase
MGNPNTAEGIAYLYENSPISKIHNINKPIMVLQGARDPRVNKEESDQMVMALKKSQIPVTYVVYPDEGHGFLKKINDFSSMAFVEKFLARHLGGQYEPLRPEELQNSSHKIIEDAVGLLEELTH